MTATSVVLKEGSKGAEVTKLQEGLKKLNFYSGIVDGVFGVKTRVSCHQFSKIPTTSCRRHCRGENLV